MSLMPPDPYAAIYGSARGVAVLSAPRTGSSMTLSLLHGRLGYPQLGEYRPGRTYDWDDRFLVKIISDASDYGRTPYLLSDQTVQALIEDPDVAFVCVERRSLVNQLLSSVIARKTRVWHTANLRDGAGAHADYLGQLQRARHEVGVDELDQMLEDVRVYETLKARLIRPARTVYYEDIEHDHQRLFSLLGLDEGPPVSIPTRRVVPDELKHRVVRNVHAVARRATLWMNEGRLRSRDPFGDSARG